MKVPFTRSTIILPKYKKEMGTCPYDYCIDAESKWIHAIKINIKSTLCFKKAAEILAYYFKREFGYDFVQYSKKGDDGIIYLFIDPWSNEFVGACCFRVRLTQNEDKSMKDRWWMDWAWFHPYYRNCGIFSKFLPVLLKNHPKFILCEPLSKTMDHLAKKYNLPSK